MEKTIKRTVATKKVSVKVFNLATDEVEILELDVAGRSKNVQKLVPEGYRFLKVEREYTSYSEYEMPLSEFISMATLNGTYEESEVEE